MRRINSKWFQIGSVAALTVTTTSGETYGFYGERRILDDGSNEEMAD